jgi:hypothetical protein
MIQLTIQVFDISTVMLVYNSVRVYVSDTRDGTYAYLATVFLQSGVSTYIYNHTAGTPDLWYKSTYYNSVTLVESSYSNPTQGESPIYHIVSYPNEYDFSSAEQLIIRKIRRLIGDLKGLSRLYLNSDETSCSYILEDDKTIDLKQKGWPAYVAVNSEEFTTLYNPIVQGYRYLTFSGTLNSTDTIEIWYNTFKFSDSEIYEAYGDAMIPPLVPTACVTQDHLILQAAIDLLQNLYAVDIVEDGASVRDDQTTYDPSPGLRERDRLLARLQKQLDGLIKECLKSSLLGLEGVLID